MQAYEKKTVQRGGQQNNVSPVQEMTDGIPNSALQEVFAGKRHADSSMMGHSQNLAPSIAAKMSRAFGMDLTGMQVYQSDAMKGTGMRGMAQGNKVVLSSDVNLNTTAGQAVLGHELSHIHAQSQGIGMGHSGLYENAALEHQADTEGLLAAQGRSIYSNGMDTGIGMQYGLGMQGVEGLTPLSGGMSAGAGAPMQAFLGKPGDVSEANQMAFNYAQNRAGKLKLDGKSTDELKKIHDDEKAAVWKYVIGLSIPKGKLKEMEREIDKSEQNLNSKDFINNLSVGSGKKEDASKQNSNSMPEIGSGKEKRFDFNKSSREDMLWNKKDEYYRELYDAAMGKKAKKEYSGSRDDISDELMGNPYQKLKNAIKGIKEESSGVQEQPKTITKQQQLQWLKGNNMRESMMGTKK